MIITEPVERDGPARARDPANGLRRDLIGEENKEADLRAEFIDLAEERPVHPFPPVAPHFFIKRKEPHVDALHAAESPEEIHMFVTEPPLRLAVIVFQPDIENTQRHQMSSPA